MTWQEICAAIEQLKSGPLGWVFIITFTTRLGEVRWNRGLVQTRRTQAETWSLPILPDEFLYIRDQA